jgi:hypothetical protein
VGAALIKIYDILAANKLGPIGANWFNIELQELKTPLRSVGPALLHTPSERLKSAWLME